MKVLCHRTEHKHKTSLFFGTKKNIIDKPCGDNLKSKAGKKS
jgi:tRNA A58 N-methylase Trm61